MALPPESVLVEVIDSEINRPMEFMDGLYVRVCAKDTAKLIAAFEIPRRCDIKRVRHIDGFSDVIVSWCGGDAPEIEAALTARGIEHQGVGSVRVPKWVPRSARQRDECAVFWPMNNFVSVPELPVDAVAVHESALIRVMKEKSVIVKKPNSELVIASDASDCCNCRCNINHGLLRALGKASKWSSENQSYLCNDLDVYCYYEPCAMCAMAMVHSRVGRLFYIEDNGDFGGIKSQVQIHCCTKLNHRYRAFKLQTNK